ncbi:hypothetical protein AAVH_01079 [Aphelenchoides avenae]|nr:hypothetical protein AAVH_01079 [Aphelenchus avenae]
MKSHGMEPIFDDDVSRIRVRVTSLDQYRNSTTSAAMTTTSSPLEKRTDSPKEPTTVEDEDKEHKEGMDEAIQSALADDALIVSTTEAGDTDAPSNVDDAETFEGSGAVEETTTSVTEEAISETTEDNASSEAANQDETSQELSAPESGAVESNEPQDLQWEDESDEPKTTLPPPTTTTRKPATTTPKPTKKPTQSSVRRSPFPSKKAPTGRRGSLPEIPEAEEEEQSDVEATTQQVNPTSTIGGLAGLNPQTVYNLNANANSNSSPNVASVITPVNSIIDGIGPLILPLLGYTNRFNCEH